MSTYLDPLGRSPDQLLEAWFTLADVAAAASSEDVRVTAVQAASQNAVLQRNHVTCRFVAERKSMMPASLAPWSSPLPRRLAAKCVLLQPDLIHYHSLSLPHHVRLLQQALPKIPFLVQDHADKLPPAWRRPLYRRGLAAIDGVAFTSRAQAEPFRRRRILADRVAVFEIAESSSRFTPGGQQVARTKTGLYGDPCLLWVAHLNENKDPLTILNALSRVRERLPAPELWCFFKSSPLLGEVRARLAAEPDLQCRVHLMGEVPHHAVEDLCRAADFFVLGSHKEGSGYAVVEALACGTPPIVTDIPAFRKLTGDGAVGGLSPPRDADAMARTLIEWSARDRDSLRQAARAHFDRALSFEVIGSQLRDAYRALAGGITRATRPGKASA